MAAAEDSKRTKKSRQHIKNGETAQRNAEKLVTSPFLRRPAGQSVADVLMAFEESPGNGEHPAS